MTPSERKRFAVAIAVLGETYGRQVTEVTIRAYELGMADLPIDLIESAVQRAVKTCKFMPVPAELRDLAGMMSPADRAIKAWDAALHAVEHYGPYKSVDFDDRVINAVIRSLGGWAAFDELLGTQEEKWLRKDFERIYISFCRSGISEEAALALPGIHDRNNTLNGYFEDVKSPMVVKTGLPPHVGGVVPALVHNYVKRLPTNVTECIDAVRKMPEQHLLPK